MAIIVLAIFGPIFLGLFYGLFFLITGWVPRFLWQNKLQRQAGGMVGDIAKEDLWARRPGFSDTLVHKDSGVSVEKSWTLDALPTYTIQGKGSASFKLKPGDVGYWRTHRMMKHYSRLAKRRERETKDFAALASINSAYRSMNHRSKDRNAQ